MDYEKAYTNAVSKIKSIIADKKKQGLTNCLFEGDLNEIFPELAQSEDERIRKVLLAIINDAKGNGCNTYYAVPINDIIAWLEKQGEQKQDPCEDCDHIMLNCGNFPCEEKKGYNVEQKSVWSEEDERMIEHICYALPKMAMGNIEILPSIAEEYAERLKSLKNRVQPHWKPTQEQLMALRDAIDNNEMESLYNDLKKL